RLSLHSFPTRRSSDLFLDKINSTESFRQYMTVHPFDSHNIVINIYVTETKRGERICYPNYISFGVYNEKIYYGYYMEETGYGVGDRKSTRLNSSHVSI